MLKLLVISTFIGLLNTVPPVPVVDNRVIIARKQVAVLCYHQILDWRASDRRIDKEYIIPPVLFKAHMKWLADSGYHTILPDQLYDYLVSGKPLPPKPIMLTFDDSDGDQFNIARPELARHNFKGVYFIVTNNLAKNKHYMDRRQVKLLADEGNVIACHTRDHANFNKLKDADWETQIDVPTRKLTAITGKPVQYFAFPYGIWNARNLIKLREHGFKAAFQLDQPRDANEPIMTIRRVIDCGYWSAQTLDHTIKYGFGKTRHQ